MAGAPYSILDQCLSANPLTYTLPAAAQYHLPSRQTMPGRMNCRLSHVGIGQGADGFISSTSGPGASYSPMSLTTRAQCAQSEALRPRRAPRAPAQTSPEAVYLVPGTHPDCPSCPKSLTRSRRRSPAPGGNNRAGARNANIHNSPSVPLSRVLSPFCWKATLGLNVPHPGSLATQRRRFPPESAARRHPGVHAYDSCPPLLFFVPSCSTSTMTSQRAVQLLGTQPDGILSMAWLASVRPLPRQPCLLPGVEHWTVGRYFSNGHNLLYRGNRHGSELPWVPRGTGNRNRHKHPCHNLVNQRAASEPPTPTPTVPRCVYI